VIAIGVVFNLLLLIMGVFTARMRQTTSEVFTEVSGASTFHRFMHRLRTLSWDIFEMELGNIPLIPHVGASKLLAYIISDSTEDVSRAVIEKLGRGVTQLQGKGMYTGEEHGVLMCVLSSNQTDLLKRIVKQADPEAFMIVVGVRDVRGAGFRPLEV